MKLTHDKLLSIVAFNFNLCHYTEDDNDFEEGKIGSRGFGLLDLGFKPSGEQFWTVGGSGSIFYSNDQAGIPSTAVHWCTLQLPREPFCHGYPAATRLKVPH